MNAMMTYEEFAAAYKKAFAATNNYTPNQVGWTITIEAFAALADAYPEWAAQVEEEIES